MTRTKQKNMTNTFSFTKYFLAVAIIACTFSFASATHAATMDSPTIGTHATTSDIQAGDLIRGTTLSSVYYYGSDGFRYTFPDEKTFSTWYKDFDSVKWVTDADLSKIPLGGNVTYKPGVKLLKLQSDPTVYAVSKNGTLRQITSASIAQELYGNNWAKLVDDLPDGFFKNYSIGSKLDLASQYSPASESLVASIDNDKTLMYDLKIQITNTGYDIPTIHVPSGQAIQFTNTTNVPHSVTEWDGKWGSGSMQPGDTFTKYFYTKGIWTYYSTFDSKNKFEGAIIVE